MGQESTERYVVLNAEFLVILGLLMGMLGLIAAASPFAAGLPVVSTDVGSCRELIDGKPDESPHLGHAGLITSIAQPEETARALIKLLQNPTLQKEMGDAGLKRAEQHYDQTKVVQRYEELYTLKDRTPKEELASFTNE